MKPEKTNRDRLARIKIKNLRRILISSFLFFFLVFSFLSSKNKNIVEFSIITPSSIVVSSSETITKTPEVFRPQDLVYLTFDDGPSDYTENLLDILKEYNVKVTFFVTGKGEDSTIRRAHEEGHTVAIHTSSHSYSYIYSSVDNYFADFNEIQSRIKNITGETTNLMRFPGGSSNTVSRRYKRGIMSELANEVESQGFVYFDWNINSGDADSAHSSSEVFENVTARLEHDGPYVVLQHDTKDYSINAVADIIRYGQSNGYIFAPLKADSFTAHHGINN